MAFLTRSEGQENKEVALLQTSIQKNRFVAAEDNDKCCRSFVGKPFIPDHDEDDSRGLRSNGHPITKSPMTRAFRKAKAYRHEVLALQ